ncbi:MAG: leucine-rich repeat domain-containing protein [Lachnospiraceae bacterium]|nr:leucine-rich repeat domain-containing protein [Lachnospiraceae bacterium]
MTFELEIKDGRVLRPILSEEVEPNHLYKYDVTIPEGVVEIADDAFYSVPEFRISKLKLPKTLRRIGIRAFKNTLDGTHNLTLPSGLEYIGDDAFQSEYEGDTPLVKAIKVPDSVKHLGARAFFGFGKLESLHLGSSITHIGDGIVAQCYLLDSVTSASPEVNVDGNALIWKDTLLAVWGEMDSYTVPPDIKEIGDWAFSSCRTEKSFYGDKKYGPEQVDLPEGLRRIGDFAFYYLRLKQLHIPDSVEEIGLNPISFCPIKELSGKFTYDGRAIIVGNHLRAHIWIAESADIPDQVGILDEQAFINFSKPESITIPSSVRVVGKECFFMSAIKELTFNEGLEKIDDEAFFWCHGLKEISFPSSLKELGSETFGFADNVRKIIFKGEIPPKFPDCIIRDENFKGIIRVPAESMDAYRQAFPELTKPTPAQPNGRILKIKTN